MYYSLTTALILDIDYNVKIKFCYLLGYGNPYGYTNIQLGHYGYPYGSAYYSYPFGSSYFGGHSHGYGHGYGAHGKYW